MNRETPNFDAIPFAAEAMPAYPQRDVIYAANVAGLHPSTEDARLSDLANAWPDPTGLREIIRFVAPQFPSRDDSFYEFKAAKQGEYFLTEVDDIRAMDADFKQVKSSGETAFGKLQNKGVSIRVDADVLRRHPDFERIYLFALCSRIYRNEWRRVVAGLTSGATVTTTTWNTDKDPDVEVMDLLDQAETSASVACNRVLIGVPAQRQRARVLALSGGGARVGASESDLASAFGVDSVRISRHRKQARASNDTRVVGRSLFAFYAEDDATPMDFSHMKRFVLEFAPGRELRAYRHEVSAAFVDLSVECYSKLLVQDTVGLTEIRINP